MNQLMPFLLNHAILSELFLFSGTKFLSESYVRFSSELVSQNQQINISLSLKFLPDTDELGLIFVR